MRVLLLCGMLLSWMPYAQAAPLRVDALRLSPDAVWQRGDPGLEREDGVYLLDWPVDKSTREIALQVAIPRQSTPLKSDPAAFQANLKKKWASLYGKRAEIGEIEIAGVRWLACRRPSGDGEAVVFQLVAAHEGRAYSLLAFTARQAIGLPAPVHDLLARAVFGAPARGWAVHHVIAAQPAGEALAALVQTDVERLGRDGMLTGYGVDSARLPDEDAAGRGQGLGWFLEGFMWRKPSGRDERVPVDQRGRIEARVPGRVADRLSVSLNLVTEAGKDVEVEVGVLDLCAPPAELDDALARLQRGARVPLERLLRGRPAACAPTPSLPPPVVMSVPPGLPVRDTLSFPSGNVPVSVAGLANRRVIYVKPRLAAGDGEVGEGLLRRLGLYFVYAPE